MDQSRRIGSAQRAAEFLKESYSKPSKTIIQKKGIGITKRVVFFVPASGPGSIDRSTLKCKTLKGSKAYRQFTDVGQPGVLDIRLLSCHECPGCRSLVARSACVNHDICGPIERVELEREAVSESRMTRHALHSLGVSLSEAAEENDVIAVELAHESETFMIGIVVPGPDGEEGVYRVTTGAQSYMGSLEPGDRVIQVRKFEPTLLGSSLYRLTEKEFPCFIEDVRYALATTDLTVDENAQAQVRRNPSRGVRQEAAVVQPILGRFDPSKAYRLASEAKDTILKRIPDDESVA